MLTLNFETITPLHISNGNQLAYNLEYTIFNGDLAKLNIEAHKKIAEAKLFDYKRNYKFYEIIKIIEQNKNIFNDSCFDYRIETVPAFDEFLRNERRDGQKIVQEFVNSNGNFYVPGSSVKGMLTTILHRDPQKNPLGISPETPSIDDKFVITDSDYIPSESFIVDIAYRPPSVNLIVLDAGQTFNCKVKKTGNMDLEDLKKKLSFYSFEQLQKARAIVNKFKEKERKPGGATQYFNFLENFMNGLKLNDDEYLVNLGFGGGSYYKLYNDAEIPKFKIPGRRNRKEEAHTTFSVNIENEFYQLGWCKLTIEEE